MGSVLFRGLLCVMCVLYDELMRKPRNHLKDVHNSIGKQGELILKAFADYMFN